MMKCEFVKQVAEGGYYCPYGKKGQINISR